MTAGIARTIGAQHVSLREQVLVALRHRIVSGVYPPGDRLTEGRPAADFGVSRNPAREALRVVEAEGLVPTITCCGALAATPDATTIADPFAVRERLEMLVAWLAAERATTAAVAHLRSLLDEVRMATDRRDFSRVAELNSEVHLHVVAISGNQWLSSIANSLYT